MTCGNVELIIMVNCLRLLLVFCILQLFFVETFCEKCKCKLDVETSSADCSGIGLTNISTILDCVPNTTRKLTLSKNSLRDIQPGIFKTFSSLEVLRLDFNKIEYLKSGAFEGLIKLQNLSLDHNNLSLDDSYASNVFMPVKNLRRLYLQHNCDIATTHCIYPDKALSAAKSIQYLQLDGFPNFGPGFSQLKNLYSLYISDDNGYCAILELKENTFESFRKTPLSFLYINGCDIRKFEKNVFRGLRNLTTLIITDNRRLCSDSIENATVGLNETSIETLRINNWCRHRSEDIHLDAGMLKGLTNTSLKTLDLGWNDINYIDSDCIKHLPISIQYLSLKENEIGRGEFLYEMRRLENLEIADISFQFHYRVKSTLTWSKSHNSFKVIKDRLADDDPVYLPKNLKILFMNNIKLEFPVPKVVFGPNKLQYLDMSDCMLTAFLGPWYGLRDLKHFDISSNRLIAFSSNSLIDMDNLTTLLLQNNHLGDSLQRDVIGQTFSSQKKLKVLNLSKNSIKALPYLIFKNQVSLKNLSLARNAMTDVSFSLKTMKMLQYLDLSDNQIEYVTSENMGYLDQIATTQDIHLNLSGNILACMCDNQQFLSWIATTKVHIIDRGQLKCLYRNKTTLSLSRINIIRSQLKYDCSLWVVMTSCVTGFVGLLLILSLIALLYHRRWQLRYLWYIGRKKIDPFHHPDEQQSRLPQIDVYISYEQHYDVTDGVTLHQTVTDYVYPFFERRGYIVKIREEFEATDKLYRVIPDTVNKTRKVVVFLTPSYCKDYWNTFEFNIAAYEGIYTKRNIIIPVLIGDFSDQNFTPEIRSFVNSKIKSKEVLRFPSQANCEHRINTFNEQLEHWLQY